LEGVVIEEGLLDGVQFAFTEILDSEDLLAGDRAYGVTQERTASPFTTTVQAPQRASPHPNLVPVRLRSERRTERSMRSPSTVTRTGLPLRVNEMISGGLII
jgi:hypothetical protein